MKPKQHYYGIAIQDDDEVMTVDEFKDAVEVGMFLDNDGYGHPAKYRRPAAGLGADIGKRSAQIIKPSRVDEIPENATHTVWYNR